MPCDRLRTAPGLGRPAWLPAGLALLVALLLASPPNARAQDVTPPQLVSFDISPGVIDVTAGPATATVTASFTDDDSGFATANVIYLDPGFSTLLPVPIDASDLISGDALNGTYQTTFEIAEFSKSGVWTVFSASMTDAADNGASIPSASLPTFEVVSIEDTGAPTLSALGAVPSAVDVTAGPGAVTITATLEDDTSGVDHATVTLESPSTLETASLDLDAGDRISGDAWSGVYEGVLEIPQLAESGLWSVESVRIVDAFGYVADLPAGSLPPPPPTVSVSWTPDAGDPQLVELTLAPPGVNLAYGPRLVLFEAHITDDVTGVANAGALLESPVLEIVEVVVFDAAHRVSGDSLDGVYQDTIDFDYDSPMGFWTITFFAADAAGNSIQLSGAALPGQTGFSVYRAPVPSDPVPSLGPLAAGILLVSLVGAGSFATRRRRTTSRGSNG